MEDRPGSDNLWRGGVSPNWDGDFYDDGFFRAFSYANTILSREKGDRKTIMRIVDPVVDRLVALTQILKWSEVFPDPKDDKYEESSYMDGESGTIYWSLPEPSGSMLDREDTIQALRSGDSSNGGPFRRYLLEGIARAVSLWNEEGFRRKDHSDWLSKRLDRPYEDINLKSYLPLLKEETAKIAVALEKLVKVDRVESFEKEIRTILEFLHLPFWRDRWFLYELWTITYVLNIGAAAWPVRLLGLISRKDGGLEWVLPGGIAKEPIAVLEGTMGSVECWSQRKTYHPTTGKGLEPDLRLTRANERHEDLVVIENKDRIKPRKGEMKEIVKRYVTGTQAKAVWLVNYEEFTGPTHALGDDWSERFVSVESNFRPGEVSEHFSESLRKILSEELGPANTKAFPAQQMPASGEIVTVTLTWKNSPEDLDLHTWIRGGPEVYHVNYHNHGSLSEPPYAQLDSDCQESPGREEVVVKGFQGGEVEIAVHQYSNDGQIGASQASVEIQRSSLGVTTLSVPRSSFGKWWRICTLRPDGNIVIRNEVTTEQPDE